MNSTQALNTNTIYFKEIAKQKLLTKNEEVRLFKELTNGNKNAARKIIEANLRLVVCIAKKYRGQGVSFEDLIQEGNLGLIRAIKTYDYMRGFRFSTYATNWIKSYIGRYVNRNMSSLSTSVRDAENYRQVKIVQQKLAQENDGEVTAEDIARATSLKAEKVALLMNGFYVASLNKPVSDEGDSEELGDFIMDNSVVDPEEIAINNLMAEEVLNSLKCLNLQERYVITKRFDLNSDCGENQTLSDIAKTMGLSRERVRQISRKAFLKLRTSHYAKGLRSYLYN